MTKIVGVSFGTKNGNNDTICKVALLAAQEAGCEIEFIHAQDLDIRHCTGCIACVKALMSGCNKQQGYYHQGCSHVLWQ